MIELSELFEELSVNFISIQDNVDTSTSMGRFFFRVMASLRYVAGEGEPIFPVGYIQHRKPMAKVYLANCYTLEQLI
ncbi:hypothetical protein EfmJHP36_27440 [Enterococcus faecium]|nr:hypothetical protein EfmJHP36_27440 [Enterococcus faecium]